MGHLKLSPNFAGLLTVAAIAGLSGHGDTHAGSQAPKPDQVRLDRYGDPLPAGAVARLGTVRYRSAERFGGDVGILGDSNTVVIGPGQSDTVLLMDASTGKVIREISTGNITINSITLSSNGDSIAVLGTHFEKGEGKGGIIVVNATVIGVFDVASGKMVQTYEIPQKDSGLGRFRIAPNLKIAASLHVQTGILTITDIATGAELARHKFPRASLPAIAFSSDGSTLAFGLGSTSQKIFLWKWQDAGEPLEINVPDRTGRVLTFAPDGKTVAEESDGRGVVRLWDVATGRLLQKLVLPNDDDDVWRASSVAYTPDGKLLIAAFQGNDASSLHVWDTATGRHEKRLDGPVGSVLVSPNGKLLVASGGGGFRAWDLGTWKEISANSEAHQSSVVRVAIRGNTVISADARAVRIWDANTTQQRFALTHDGHAIHDIALSPDGTKLASAGNEDKLCLWDATTGKLIYSLAGHGRLGGREAVGFTADGKHFLSYGRDNYMRKWEVATGKAILEHIIQPKGVKLPPNADEPMALNAGDFAALNSIISGSFSADGTVFVLDTRNDFHVFDVATGKDLYQIDKGGEPLGSHTISPDGRLLLASAAGKNVITKLPSGVVRTSGANIHKVALWELATRQIRMQMDLPGGKRSLPAFSPDGKRFAVATYEPDRRVYIYDMANGKKASVVEGFRGTVNSLAFSTDGQRLVTGMSDTTVLVWDLAALRMSR
jgi:WD40 repeat protein